MVALRNSTTLGQIPEYFYIIDPVSLLPSKVILTYKFLRKDFGNRKIVTTHHRESQHFRARRGLKLGNSFRLTSMQNTKNKATHVNLAC